MTLVTFIVIKITMVTVSSDITQEDLSKSKVDPCRFCSFIVKANSALCVQCCRWIHGRCAGMKRVTLKSSRNITCIKCEGHIGEAVEQEEKLCDEVESARELTYHGDRVSACGGCEAAVTARTRCGWVKLRK